MSKDEPSAVTQRPTAKLRRSPLRTLFLVRAVPFVLAVLVLGIVALATGHDKSGLPVIIFAGLTCVLNLAAWLRRRRKEPPG
jgi:uncharacterized membrane protein YhhN